MVPRDESRRSVRRWARDPRTWVLVVLLALAGSELALRARGPGRSTAILRSARYGWELVPSQSVEGRVEGAPMRINRSGFRDREWERPPEPGPAGDAARAETLRIAVLGNSTTFGLDVPLERTWARLLEQSLAEELASRGDPRRVLAMNFAVPGYAIEQMARVYDDRVRPYRPDIVAIALTAFDVRAMPVVRVPRDYPLRNFVLQLSLYERAQALLGTRGELAPFGYLPDEGYELARRRYDQIEDLVRLDPLGAAAAPLWEAALQRLDSILSAARADGSRLVLSGLPMLDDLLEPTGPDTTARWRDWAARQADVIYADPRPYLQRSIEAVLRSMRREGIARESIWSAARTPGSPPAVALPGTNPFLPHDPNHLSADGHAALADCVLASLRAAGLP